MGRRSPGLLFVAALIASSIGKWPHLPFSNPPERRDNPRLWLGNTVRHGICITSRVNDATYFSIRCSTYNDSRICGDLAMCVSPVPLRKSRNQNKLRIMQVSCRTVLLVRMRGASRGEAESSSRIDGRAEAGDHPHAPRSPRGVLRRREETGQSLNDLLIEAAARLVGVPRFLRCRRADPGAKAGKIAGASLVDCWVKLPNNSLQKEGDPAVSGPRDPGLERRQMTTAEAKCRWWVQDTGPNAIKLSVNSDFFVLAINFAWAYHVEHRYVHKIVIAKNPQIQDASTATYRYDIRIVGNEKPKPFDGNDLHIP